MKVCVSIVLAAALASAAGGAAHGAIPADGGYSDGLRAVYEQPLTPDSAVVRERYYPCRLRTFAFGLVARPAPRATATAWCRYLPEGRDAAPLGAAGAVTDDSGEGLLAVPLRQWRPL